MDEEIQEIKLDNQNSSKPQMSKAPQGKKRCLLLGLVVFVIAIIIFVGLGVWRTYQSGIVAYQKAVGLKDALKTQDLTKISQSLTGVKQQVAVVKADANLLSWTEIIPYVGHYTSDLNSGLDAAVSGLEAGEVMVKAVEPYADILGLKGQGTFAGGTAEERIAKAVETLDKVTPQIDEIATKISAARMSLDKIDPNRYPEKINGKAVRSQIVALKEGIDLADEMLVSARPMVKQLPKLLGTDGEKKYMILFQNDAELRPTGGFITAYAIFRVEKGKINLDTSDDIYKLDDTMTKHVAPPDPISKYLNVYGWRMRDSNFSPDFLVSMKTFEDLYANSSVKEPIDGIMAMDTHVLVTLMKVLGPVSAYGTNFTTDKVPACDCPMIIYELEKFADEPKNYERGSRKDIIGVLLQDLLKKALGAPKQVYGQLFQAGLQEAKEKHLLVYLHNEDGQKGVEALNFAGRIKTSDGDYLHVNDANLAGAKSNLYIVSTVKQEVSINDTGASTTLTLDYRYPHSGDNCSLERTSGLCLAGIYRDYLRVYLPKGAVVEQAQGFESKSNTFADLDHTVIDGFFTVVPQGLAKIQITYKVNGNFKQKKLYTSLIQKQPGTVGNDYKVIVNGKQQEFNLTEDKEISVKL